MQVKPNPTDRMDAPTFDAWYWDKPELVAICTHLGLPKTGGKDALRDRVLTFLRSGEVKRETPKQRGRFNWARETLTLETVITETVSFGPNFRTFMAAQIGPAFSCHADFMTWVRAHPGQTLSDAIDAWHALDARKNTPGFRREIAPHNNYLQYLRDYRDANPDHGQDEAKAAWHDRKKRPIEGQRIVYAPEDRR